LLFLLLYSVGCYSQNEARFIIAEPAQEGFSTELPDQLRPVLQKYIDEHKLPGLITMVARHGKRTYYLVRKVSIFVIIPFCVSMVII
jgi:hypothetical protein